MPSRHHKRWYRIVAICLAYLLFGAAILVPLGVQKEPNVVLLIVVGSLWLALLIGTIVANEIYIQKKYGGDFLKKEEDEDGNR